VVVYCFPEHVLIKAPRAVHQAKYARSSWACRRRGTSVTVSSTTEPTLGPAHAGDAGAVRTFITDGLLLVLGIPVAVLVVGVPIVLLLRAVVALVEGLFGISLGAR
jgi:hypothetical protein